MIQPIVLIRVLLMVSFVGGALPGSSFAQTEQPATRAEALRKEREEKQQALIPNERDGLQRGLDYVENRALFLLTREGFYPKIGSLTTGSGFAAGLGFRDRDLLAPNGVAELWAAGTFRKYWAIQARVAFPEVARGRLMFEALGDLRDYPEESFYGIGPDSLRENPVIFPLRQKEVVGRVGVRPWPKLLVGGRGGWYHPRTENSEVDYLTGGGFVEVDYREPLNARRGGWYRLGVTRFDDRETGRFSFTRADLDVRQFIGFLADRRVIAVRGLVSTTEAVDDGLGIPVYLMPTLGGNDTLRGFRDYRFRGPHAILAQAEYRWEIWSGLDAALFYDAGKVALRRSDLNFKNLEDDYGFGFRFNTAQGIVMRIDAAFGSKDGKHLHIVFGGVF
jgi:hypothetical protein